MWFSNLLNVELLYGYSKVETKNYFYLIASFFFIFLKSYFSPDKYVETKNCFYP